MTRRKYLIDEFIVYIWFYPTNHHSYAGIPCYVGKGREGRITAHVKNSHNRRLNNLFKKYGDLPVVIVRDGLLNKEAITVEIALITAIGRADLGKGPLFNLTNGGDGLSDPSQETLRRLSESHAGQTPSEANRRAISLATKGKPRPQHVIEAARAANKGKRPSQAAIDASIAVTTTPEFAENQRQLMLSRWADPVFAAKMIYARRNRRQLTKEESAVASLKKSKSMEIYYSTLSLEDRVIIYGKSRRGKIHPNTGVPRTDEERAKIINGLASMSSEAEAARVTKISKWWANRTEEEKAEINRKRCETRKRTIALKKSKNITQD